MEKCVGLCTVGARIMCGGRNNSVTTKIREMNHNTSWIGLFQI